MARSRTNRRRKPRQPRWRMPRIPWRSLLLLPTAALLVTGVFLATMRLLDQPVRALVVSATFQRVTTLQVEEALAEGLDQGFLSIDLKALRARLERLEWVAEAQIERRWPGTLAVQIVEHVAAARWGDSGLLNTSGELFTDANLHLFPELPQLSGPAGSEATVAGLYLSLRGRLAEAGLTLSNLVLDERGAWYFRLDDGTEVRLGRRETGARIERFFAVVVAQLAPRLDDIQYVDLRYSNGFAVGWHSLPPGGALARVGASNG